MTNTNTRKHAKAMMVKELREEQRERMRHMRREKGNDTRVKVMVTVSFYSILTLLISPRCSDSTEVKDLWCYGHFFRLWSGLNLL